MGAQSGFFNVCCEASQSVHQQPLHERSDANHGCFGPQTWSVAGKKRFRVTARSWSGRSSEQSRRGSANIEFAWVPSG